MTFETMITDYDFAMNSHLDYINSPFVTKMETNNMHNMEHTHTHTLFTRVSSRTGNVWSVSSQGAVSQTVSLNLNPAATNWLEPSQSSIGGEGGGESGEWSGDW